MPAIIEPTAQTVDIVDLAMGRITRKIIANGGITRHHVTGEEPETGYAVSIYPTLSKVIPVEEFDTQTLFQFTFANRRLLQLPDHYLGAWVSEGKVYLDVSIVVDDVDAAKYLGKHFNQMAAWDIERGTEVWIEAPVELIAA